MFLKANTSFQHFLSEIRYEANLPFARQGLREKERSICWNILPQSD